MELTTASARRMEAAQHVVAELQAQQEQTETSLAETQARIPFLEHQLANLQKRLSQVGGTLEESMPSAMSLEAFRLPSRSPSTPTH